MQNITQFILLLALIFSSGCGSPSTPESTLQALKTAAKNRDASAMCSLFSPDSIALMNEQQMSYCFEGYLFEMHPDQVPEHKKSPSPDKERKINVYRAAKVAGIDESILREITQDGDGTPLLELYSRAADSITNKVAFQARCLEISNAFEKEIGTDSDVFAVWNNATFGVVEEKGDKATAKVSMNGRETEYHFQRLDNQWRFHIPENAR